MKIKIVLQHFVSKRDQNGNCYWYHKATNTNTGHSLYWESPHSSNAYSATRKALGDAGHDEILECGAQELPIREFDAKRKNLRKYDNLLHDSCKDAHIIKAIRNLRFKKRGC